jgi:hypothetical protein
MALASTTGANALNTVPAGTSVLTWQSSQ